MSAVWRASRAAVRRRRLQTFVIGLVVLFSTATIVVALGLLEAASGPFDKGFAQQHGAHAVAAYDSAKVSDARLREASEADGVEAAAGPYPLAVLQVPEGNQPRYVGPFNVVGRSGPGGDVDRVDLWKGRWATAPGEIVVNDPRPATALLPFEAESPGFPLGDTIKVPGLSDLTVVGYAHSLSNSADGWVSPDQIDALGPTMTEMLYRFTDHATDADVAAGLTAVDSTLPSDSLLASHSYLTIQRDVASGPGSYVPFLLVFGVLGLAVAVLIVANVVSGAVISGFRHIGVLKALGFTPGQVTTVYLLMVSVPAVLGCVLGTALGDLAARPLLSGAFQGTGMRIEGISLRVELAALIGMPLVVLLAALVPALRARRLSATEAISAGSAPRRTGHGLRIQRRLSGTRLPRAVSLGLGLPLARPGRTALTLSAIVLGVLTVTFASGLADTVVKVTDASQEDVDLTMRPANPFFGEETAKERSDREMEALLRSAPGAAEVTPDLIVPLVLVGQADAVDGFFLRGDHAALGYEKQLVDGRWLKGPGETVVASEFLKQTGGKVGDRLTLVLEGKRTEVTVVGSLMNHEPNRPLFDRGTLTRLDANYRPQAHQYRYHIKLDPETTPEQYAAAVDKAAGPGLHPIFNEPASFTVAVISLSTALSLMLGTVAALGVFNTVVLNTRERRRDMGMLKSIGMTPRQVIAMVVTSMAALGAIGGLIGVPLGMVAHRVVVPLVAEAALVTLPSSVLDVWAAPTLALLALAGVTLAVIGALIPARRAARLTISEALRGE
ncbi:ABC transporter permease [Streptomyces sp. NBC_01353]|uniref:ABC transporter permease n=1 Tax=Streptomyces sp. NBC_01353 TaxID=2903835 RepID=UPI002E33F308|nr:FtsX-like permease family protein [Streptomyces sp. NBC_01353]